MSDPHSMESILEDETLAPLKRNSACLQCKRRKVKCDAVKPTCNPCLRSHAHALRSASRNGTAPPELCCTYGDADDSDHSPSREPESLSFGAPRKDVGERKRTSATKKLDKSLEREKDRRKDEEKESLLSRIAELEERLSKATRSSSASNSPFTPESFDGIRRPHSSNQQTRHTTFATGASPDRAYSTSNYARPAHIVTEANGDVSSDHAGFTQTQCAAIGDLTDLGLADLFMIPYKWPQNLPAPFLLEHLIETFFVSCPYDARMIHRATLMNRIRKSPTDPDFPHASLLHAICAVGAQYTAWVPAIAPHLLEETIENHNATGAPLESIADFSLAQAEASRRCIGTSVNVCGFGPGRALFDVLQAHALLPDVYMRKGLPLQSWMIAGQPARLVKILEIATRRIAKRYKEPVLPSQDLISAIEREERRATVWESFILDAIFGLNSTWGGSFKLSEIHCNLPTSQEEWRTKGDFMLENPQNPHDPDVFINHPVVDSFVLLCKAAILASRANAWLDSWNQREVVMDADDMEGVRRSDFCQLQNDIRAFQASTTLVTRNMLKVDDGFGGQSAILDPNLLMVHIFPNVVLISLYEPFIRRDLPNNQPAMVVQQALEAIVSVLHMIPSNLDLSKLFNSMIVFSLLTSGRMLIDAMQHAVEQMNFGLAIKLQSDLTVFMGLMERHASHSAIALHMKQFLETYLKSNATQRLAIKNNCSKMEEARMRDVMRSRASDSFPPSGKLSANDSGTSSTGMSPYLDMSGSSSTDQTSPESAAEAFGYLPSMATGPQPPASQQGKGAPGGNDWSYAAQVTVEELDSIGWRTEALCG